MTAEQIEEKLEINIDCVDELREDLQANPMVEIVAGPPLSFKYKPRHKLRNREDLEELLLEQGFWEEEELKDSYKGVLEDIQALKDMNRVICVTNTATKQTILFPRKMDPSLQLSKVLCNLWHKEVKVPKSAADLRLRMAQDFHLKSLGEKVEEEERKRKRGEELEEEENKKKRKRRNGNVKIHNIHVEGVDFSKDYQDDSGNAVTLGAKSTNQL